MNNKVMIIFVPFTLFHSCPKLKGYIKSMAIIFLLFPLPVKALDLSATVIEAPDFNNYFNEYYNALADYNVEDLRLELFETIEDILSTGSHLSAVSLDYKTRHIETELLNHLQKTLCTKQPEDSNLTILKLISARGVDNAGNDAEVQFSHQELGMLAGVAVRLVQRMPKSQLCNAIE
jgi:hypothetical protein